MATGIGQLVFFGVYRDFMQRPQTDSFSFFHFFISPFSFFVFCFSVFVIPFSVFHFRFLIFDFSFLISVSRIKFRRQKVTRTSLMDSI